MYHKNWTVSLPTSVCGLLKNPNQRKELHYHRHRVSLFRSSGANRFSSSRLPAQLQIVDESTLTPCSVKKGKVGKRVGCRVAGKATGKAMRKLFK